MANRRHTILTQPQTDHNMASIAVKTRMALTCPREHTPVSCRHPAHQGGSCRLQGPGHDCPHSSPPRLHQGRPASSPLP
ncbi:hypothetical protein ACOMHN_003951 [Nucella lapillus]